MYEIRKVLLFQLGCMYIGVDLYSKPVVCNAGASWNSTYRKYWALFTCGAGILVICGYLSIIAAMRYKTKKATGSIAEQQKERQGRVTKVAQLVLIGYIGFGSLQTCCTT